MSSTLVWRPVSEARNALPFALKKSLSRKLWGTDGSCGGEPAVVGASLIPYLEGLRDAGIEGAGELINLIQVHGKIELWHEH